MKKNGYLSLIYCNVSRICNAYGGFVDDNVREFIHRWSSEAAECG